MLKRIRQVIQPEDKYICGQCCVAMVTGVSLTRAIKAVGHSHCSTTKDLARAVRKLGLKCPDRLVRITQTRGLSDLCIVKQETTDRGGSWHWIVASRGKLFDPSPYGPSHARFTSFLPVEN